MYSSTDEMKTSQDDDDDLKKVVITGCVAHLLHVPHPLRKIE